MSSIFLFCVVFVPGLLLIALERTRAAAAFSILLIVCGSIYLVILHFVDDAMPFAGGGDDYEYFRVSQVTFKHLADWFNLSQFSWTHEQAGYPLLLAWIHQIAGGSVFHRKALNLFFYLLLAVTWFIIGRLIGGNSFARSFGIAILLGTPLWHYWMYLYKDMTITLLQSLFLLSIVSTVLQRSRTLGYIGLFFTTVLVIPFRSLLAFVNLSVLCATIWVRRKSSERRKSSLFSRILMASCIVLSILYIGRNPGLMAQLGVRSAERSLDTSAIEHAIDFRSQIGLGRENPLKFALIFLVGEVNTFNPRTWARPGIQEYRSFGMLPWIYLGLPLFFSGLAATLKPSPQSKNRALTLSPHLENKQLSGESEDLHRRSFDRTAMFIPLVFIAAYVAVSWISQDTTRWRLPAMPAMLALAALGWMQLTPSRRARMLILWFIGVSAFATIYYTAFK